MENRKDRARAQAARPLNFSNLPAGNTEVAHQTGEFHTDFVRRQRATLASHRAIAADMSRALRGAPSADGWLAPCPFAHTHSLRKGCGEASLSIRATAEGVDVECREGCDTEKLRKHLTTYGHLPRVSGSVRHKGDEEALRIWREETRPIAGTHGAACLNAIGIDLRHTPSTIRFRRPGIVRLPMIAALVQSPDRIPIALHLLLLCRDEPRLATWPTPQRVTIGTLGRGAVRLCAPSPEVEIVDDLLEALRAAQAGRSAWCGLGSWRRDWIEIPTRMAEAA